MNINEEFPLALVPGTILAGRYKIEQVLGQGGFGITYKAMDTKLEKDFAVKEYFPDLFSYRTENIVIPFSGERTEDYDYGKKCFLAEAKTLARFIDNEAVIRIHRYFEENNTAYFVMDYFQGKSFDHYLKEKGGIIPFEEAEKLLVPVMDALAAVHSEGIIHRDVTPDNIYIKNDGKVVLLDFGSARYSLGDKSRMLDVILKPGFAPKEQYIRKGRQGKFTDIYSLGATFYFAITGKIPPDSFERLEQDELIPPRHLGVNISSEKENAILRALSVQASARFQTMDEFKDALLNGLNITVRNDDTIVFSDDPASDTLPKTVAMENSIPKTVAADNSIPKTVAADDHISKTVSAENSIPKTVATDNSIPKTVAADNSILK